MTHIEQMIQDLCPNGVEWKTLGEVCDVYTGGEPPIDCIKTKAPEGDYIYPIYSNGVGDNAIYGFAKTYTINERAVTFSSIGTIGHPTLREGKFTPIIRLKVIIPKDDSSLNISFVKYALDVAKFSNNKSSLPNINAQMLKQIEIPLPPLEIQKKIVECLDKFSALAAELQAELQKRRTQYEYYRTQLLTPPPTESNSADKSDDAQWEWKTLGEVCEINRGVRVVKNELEKEGKYPVYQNSLTPLGYYDKSNYPANTTFVISAGAAGKVGFSDVDFWAADDCLCIKCPEIISSKYLYYYMLDKQDFFLSQVRHASVPRMSRIVVENFKLPIPPLAEQERIVAILDKFEALTTSLSDGIPAEQAAQQKRYEYYRDKLLTFEKRP